MNCKTFKENLDSLLDGEIHGELEKEAIEHMQHCVPCKNLYFCNKRIKELIKKCCTEVKAPKHLYWEVKEMIHKEKGGYQPRKTL